MTSADKVLEINVGAASVEVGKCFEVSPATGQVHVTRAPNDAANGETCWSIVLQDDTIADIPSSFNFISLVGHFYTPGECKSDISPF